MNLEQMKCLVICLGRWMSIRIYVNSQHVQAGDMYHEISHSLFRTNVLMGVVCKCHYAKMSKKKWINLTNPYRHLNLSIPNLSVQA